MLSFFNIYAAPHSCLDQGPARPGHSSLLQLRVLWWLGREPSHPPCPATVGGQSQTVQGGNIKYLPQCVHRRRREGANLSPLPRVHTTHRNRGSGSLLLRRPPPPQEPSPAPLGSQRGRWGWAVGGKKPQSHSLCRGWTTVAGSCKNAGPCSIRVSAHPPLPARLSPASPLRWGARLWAGASSLAHTPPPATPCPTSGVGGHVGHFLEGIQEGHSSQHSGPGETDNAMAGEGSVFSSSTRPSPAEHPGSLTSAGSAAWWPWN